MICSSVALPFVLSGQSLEGRVFTPKSTYLVGEPIFITLEVNNNSQKPVWIDSRLGQPCLYDNTMTVVGAKRAWYEWVTPLRCYGGIAGSCASSGIEIRPGATHSARIFLNDYYHLNEPGTYEVRIARSIATYIQDDYSRPGPPVEATADFDIQLAQGSEEELKTAFQPVLEDLGSTNQERRWQAIQAVTEMAQPFLTPTIMDLSKSPQTASAAIKGLHELNTPQTRQRLADLGEKGNADAMQALAALGDKHYLPLFYRLGRNLKGSEQSVAIESAGLLGGDQAVPFLSSFLSTHDPAVRMAAIRGLAGTVSQRALAPLILEIRDPDPNVRQIVNAALAQLTHLSASRNALDFVPNPTATFQKWHDWWRAHGSSAPIYGPTDCAEPAPLN